MIRGRMVLLALSGLLLAGCATPLERCLMQASTEVRFLEAELTERRMNIARGYAVREERQIQWFPDLCYGPRGQVFSCMEPVEQVREIRRPINVGDEEERIAQLERSLARDRRTAAQAQAQCRADFPDEG